MQKMILVMGGSFNPPTLAHQRLLLGVVDAMGADLGIFVPASHRYVSMKMKREKHPKEVLRPELRLRMLQAMCADDPRLQADDCEFYREDRGYTYETMEAIQQKYPEAQICFLAGGDKVSAIARWHRIREFLERFRIVVVKRDGDDPEQAIAENPFLSRYRDRFLVVPAPEGLEGISSSAVRSLLRYGKPGAQEMLHRDVWNLLTENGGMEK